ncbi:MAG: hypothetical protein NG740_00310 [Omnitrophica bacterium]|nr:hypothetical protein [Candidatus Omnitrophota bacterium]
MSKLFQSLLVVSLLFIQAPYSIAAETPAEDSESIEAIENKEAVEEITGLEATEEFETFSTAYTTIFYTHEEDLEAFLWNITGDQEINIYSYPGLAKNRIDRLVEKVEAILDMYPARFHIKIYVYRHYERGPIAFYSHATNSITTYANTSTEATLLHEIAHALIRAYFKVLPPAKIREMIAQYVDQHLRSN